MRCQGIGSSPAQGVSHLIVYGIEGRQNYVSSDVFDVLYYFENNKMTFNTEVEFAHTIDMKK